MPITVDICTQIRCTHTHMLSLSHTHILSVARTRHTQSRQSDSYVHSRLLIVSSCVGERATSRAKERERESGRERDSIYDSPVRCVYAASATIMWPIVLACKLRLFSGCHDHRLQKHRGVERGRKQRGGGIRNISTRRTKVKVLNRKRLKRAGGGETGAGAGRKAASLLFRERLQTELKVDSSSSSSSSKAHKQLSYTLWQAEA